jgi:competence protein ComEA
MPKLYSLVLVFLFYCSTVLALATVNLNTASQAQLEALPGVGAVTAQAIMAARPFKSVADLKNVKGIGDARFNKIAPMVTAAAEPVPAAPARAANSPISKSAQEMSRMNTPVQSPIASASAGIRAGEQINLNSASETELERLPGIGPKKAEAIIQARPFHAIEEVMKVKGIKQGIFAKIKNNITVE